VIATDRDPEHPPLAKTKNASPITTRTTYFGREDGTWRHRFGREEYDLFMPETLLRGVRRRAVTALAPDEVPYGGTSFISPVHPVFRTTAEGHETGQETQVTP